MATNQPRRVLYLLNVSNPDQLTADSGWVIADLLATAMTDAGAQVTVAAPAPVSDPRVGHAATASPGSKYRARFDGDVATLADLVRTVDPTVVVANQIEAAPTIRAALLEAGSTAVLAGYCHYLPFSVAAGRIVVDPSLDDGGLGWPVLLQFVAGLAACDRLLVHSATARDWVLAVARQTGVDISERLRVVPPPRDPALVDGERAPRRGGRMVGLYNHRLYAHYGTGRFVDLATGLTSDTVELMVMDLFGVRRPGRVGLDDSPERFRAALSAVAGVRVVSDGGDRTRYRSYLTQADFGIAPFRAACPWSLSVIDCQAMGLPVISPRLGWAATHIDPQLLFDTPAQAKAIAARLAGDAGFYREHSARARASTDALDPPAVARAYLEAVG